MMLNNLTSAVADTDAAIQCDPTLAIAYYRKASALSKMVPATEKSLVRVFETIEQGLASITIETLEEEICLQEL